MQEEKITNTKHEVSCPHCQETILEIHRNEIMVPEAQKPYWSYDGDTLPLDELLSQEQRFYLYKHGLASLDIGSCLCCDYDYTFLEIISTSEEAEDNYFCDLDLHSLTPDSNSVITNWGKLKDSSIIDSWHRSNYMINGISVNMDSIVLNIKKDTELLPRCVSKSSLWSICSEFLANNFEQIFKTKI